MAVITADQAGGQNRVALLDTIAVSEMTQALLDATDDGYNVLVGSTAERPLTFDSYATHPDIYNARFCSTAAGRYQELYRNWIAYRARLDLPDFGPLSQDRMALQQIKEANALPAIDAGDFGEALGRIAHLWASLPGAAYGQHEQHLAMLQAVYQNAGGFLA